MFIPRLASTIVGAALWAAFVMVSGAANAQTARDFEAGPIWSNTHADQVCPALCERNDGQWRGGWTTTIEGQQSVCTCHFETAGPAAPAAPATGGFAGTMLNAHNAVRANHGAPPLTWSPALARTSQNWADRIRGQGCTGPHSPASDPQFRSPGAGENMYFTSSDRNPGQDALDWWYWCEIDQYDPAEQGSAATGHYSQVIWNATRELGCGVARCEPAEQQVWPGEPYPVNFVVCQYGPAGNVSGLYSENVNHRLLSRPANITCPG